MAQRRRKSERQEELWISSADVVRSPGHVFYERLNGLLSEAGFDEFVEELTAPFYANGGRPGIAPGVYFRMLFVGYFEGIDSQRGIAWRCEDSLSLRKFLGLSLTDSVPDHSSLTRIRDRFPVEVTERVFAFVLQMACERRLISGTQVGVDSTLLEASAAMKTIVRRDTDEDWKDYIRRLMREEGVIDDDDDLSDEELRRFDRQRKGKKVSNTDWKSSSDEDARIVKMKDGRTHFGYKAEHTVDLETEVILSATVQEGTAPDSQTLLPAVVDAQINLVLADSDADIVEVAADKGYHSNTQITDCTAAGLRTYIPEPNLRHNRRWSDKPEDVARAVLNNRDRTRRAKSKQMQRHRSERVERSFAHVCDSGGARRTWLRGLEKINKRYSMTAAAHNLGLLMRTLLGSGKPRALASLMLLLSALLTTLQNLIHPTRNTTTTLKPVFQRTVSSISSSNVSNTPLRSLHLTTVSTSTKPRERRRIYRFRRRDAGAGLDR